MSTQEPAFAAVDVVETVDVDVDVVVVGAGGAGLAAAIAGAEAGATVLLLDKASDLTGSSTAISAGMLAFADTAAQRERGIEDSREAFERDILDVGRQLSDQVLVDAYLEEQLDTFDWLCSLGVPWTGVHVAGGMSASRGHTLDPLDLVLRLEARARELGVRIVYDAAATRLTRPPEQTQWLLEGTRVPTGETFRVMAPSVVMATGGFSRDSDMLCSLDPRFEQVVAISGAGNTGDGLRLLRPQEPDLRDLEHVKPTFGIRPGGDRARDIFEGYHLGAIIVNAVGARFVDESISYKDLGMALLDQPGATGFLVFDEAIRRRALEIGGVGAQGLEEHRLRFVRSAPTLAALADLIDADPEILGEAVESYNADVATGADRRFGRRTLAWGVGRIRALSEPPFHAYPATNFFPGTYAGVRADRQMRMLSHGNPVPGLFVAGELVGGFHGSAYHSGTAIGKALIFGRLAGRNAANVHAR